MSGRRVRLSFVQFWALRVLVAEGGGPMKIGAFERGPMQWPARVPWLEAQTLRALARKGLIVLEARDLAITDDGRRALEAAKHYTRPTVQL